MGFVKIGDAIEISGMYDKSDSKIVCSKCDMPMVTIAIKENDELELVCQCESLENTKQ